MRWRPLEILNGVVVAALLALVCAAALTGRAPRWPILLGGCVAMLVGVLAMSWLARRQQKLWTPVGLLVDFYPLALIPLVYDTLGLVIPAIHPTEYDAALMAADRWLFGTDPTVWLQRIVSPPLTDLLYIAYATFFFFPLAVGIPLYRRSRAAGRWFVFLVALTFYISYTGYILVPAQGPRAALAGVYTVELKSTPVANGIASTLDYLERNRVDVFPSGHTMVTAVCLLVAARYVRGWFFGLLPVALLLFFSTVYCRYHYVIDVIAGLVLAGLMPPLGRVLYRRLGGEPPGRAASADGV